MSKGQGSRSGGSKFLPGGGNGGNKNNNQHITNQTSRSIHTNPSHIGGRGGK